MVTLEDCFLQIGYKRFILIDKDEEGRQLSTIETSTCSEIDSQFITFRSMLLLYQLHAF